MQLTSVGLVGTIASYAQLGMMFFTLVPVEVALKKNFDAEGNRRG
jgi:hypothetical protein